MDAVPGASTRGGPGRDPQAVRGWRLVLDASPTFLCTSTRDTNACQGPSTSVACKHLQTQPVETSRNRLRLVPAGNRQLPGTFQPPPTTPKHSGAPHNREVRGSSPRPAIELVCRAFGAVSGASRRPILSRCSGRPGPGSSWRADASCASRADGRCVGFRISRPARPFDASLGTHPASDPRLRPRKCAPRSGEALRVREQGSIHKRWLPLRYPRSPSVELLAPPGASG
jgi:hypothetical protein